MASAYKEPMTKAKLKKLQADLQPILDSAINRAVEARKKVKQGLTGWGYIRSLDDSERTPWSLD